VQTRIEGKHNFRFHLRFRNRNSAAVVLSDLLGNKISLEDRENFMVVGIARAGIITANIVSQKLQISDFDIVVPSKLTLPNNNEQAIGAIMEDGTLYLVKWRLEESSISEEYLERQKIDRMQQTMKRSETYGYRAKRLADQLVEYKKSVILVDDGASTGATLISVVKWIKKLDLKHEIPARRIIVAVPVAPKSTSDLLRLEYNLEVQAVTSPSRFYSVQEFYQQFQEVADGDVIGILTQRGMI
jgi:putative phosphoribosyl transferase